MTDAGAPRKKVRLAERVGVNKAELGDLGDAAHTASVEDSFSPASEQRRTNTAAAAPPSGGRAWTVTVAVPGSIVDNAQTHELRSYLVGQVARACAIFNVDEIVVFTSESGRAADAGRSDGSVFMARLLQYIECPQYLRKHIFPVHPDLRCVGLLAPLDAPHHLRIEEHCEYREAVVVPAGSTARRTGGGGGGAEGAGGADEGATGAAGAGDAKSVDASSSGSVYTGLRKELKIGQQLPVGTRVTVRMPATNSSNARAASVVPPREPREAAGMYWGYDVRLARGLAAVWSECPYEDGYDLSIGTSEHGTPAVHLETRMELPSFRHLLIVFGGVEGLEPAVAAEDALADCEDDVPSLFDHYLNLCPGQGSRTIRTEEALLVGLAALKPSIERAAGALRT